MAKEEIERTLPNLNVRGKRKKKALELGITPVAAEVYRDKIDESRVPELELQGTLDDIVVTGEDKRKPLDLGISRIDSDINKRIDDSNIPLYVTTPTARYNSADAKSADIPEGTAPTAEIDQRRATERKAHISPRDAVRYGMAGIDIKPSEVEVEDVKAGEVPVRVSVSHRDRVGDKGAAGIPEGTKLELEIDGRKANEQEVYVDPLDKARYGRRVAGIDVKPVDAVIEDVKAKEFSPRVSVAHRDKVSDEDAVGIAEADSKRDIDGRKAREIPLYVSEPEKAKTARERVNNLKIAGGEAVDAVVDGKAREIPIRVSEPEKARIARERVGNLEEARLGDAEKSEVSNEKLKDVSPEYVSMAPYLGDPKRTQETIAKAHSIYDIEKEAQAKRDQEKIDAYTDAQAKRLLNEAFKEEGGDPKKTKTHDDVEIIDDTLEEEDVPAKGESKDADTTPEKEMSQAEWQKSLYDKIFTDSEADKKKKKAAQWILAAQMLGDSIAALGNSYFTSKGANAMTLNPGTAKAAEATSQLSKDIRDAQEKAYKAKIAEVKEAYDRKYREGRDKVEDAQKAATQALQEKNYNLQLEKFNAEKAQKEQAQRNYEQAQQTAQAQWQQEFDLKKKTAEASIKKSLKEDEPLRFDAGDGYVDIPREYVNEQTIGKIFNMLPQEIKDAVSSPRYTTDDYGNTVEVSRKAPDLKEMIAAIGMGMDDENIRKAIKELASGKKIAPAKGVVSSTDAATIDGTLVTKPTDSGTTYGAASDWGSSWRDRMGFTNQGNDGRTKVDLSKL